MGNRKDQQMKSLRSSSDDDDEEPVEPGPSRTNDLGQADPSTSSNDAPYRRSQAKKDRDLLWSILSKYGNPVEMLRVGDRSGLRRILRSSAEEANNGEEPRVPFLEEEKRFKNFVQNLSNGLQKKLANVLGRRVGGYFSPPRRTEYETRRTRELAARVAVYKRKTANTTTSASRAAASGDTQRTRRSSPGPSTSRTSLRSGISRTSQRPSTSRTSQRPSSSRTSPPHNTSLISTPPSTSQIMQQFGTCPWTPVNLGHSADGMISGNGGSNVRRSPIVLLNSMPVNAALGLLNYSHVTREINRRNERGATSATTSSVEPSGRPKRSRRTSLRNSTRTTLPDIHEDVVVSLDTSADSLGDLMEIEFSPEQPAAAGETADDNPQETAEVIEVPQPVSEHSRIKKEVVNSQPEQLQQEEPKKEDDDKNSSRTLKEMNHSLLRLLECPVCIEWIEPPISQCRRGHLVCSRCRERISVCPICRCVFSSVRNRAMEEVSEMVRFPCRHGCGEEFQMRIRANHEASCPARRYTCPVPGCRSGCAAKTRNLTTELVFNEVLPHIEKEHPLMLHYGATQTFRTPLDSELHEHWFMYGMSEMFHVRLTVDVHVGVLVLYVSYMGPKCNAKYYTYQVSIIEHHSNRELVYMRTVHSDLDNYSSNFASQDCFHLSLNQASHYLRLKGELSNPNTQPALNISVKITKKEPSGSARDDSD